jgi:hypothetical protein
MQILYQICGFQMVCNLFFHSPNGIFLRTEDFNFDKDRFIKFFICHAFNGRATKSLPNLWLVSLL